MVWRSARIAARKSMTVKYSVPDVKALPEIKRLNHSHTHRLTLQIIRKFFHKSAFRLIFRVKRIFLFADSQAPG
jgi:hypothetical protein